MSTPQMLDPIDVLLVEDDPGDTLMIREAFADNKVRNSLTSVTDGVEAMRFLRREGEYADAPRPDLVLLDLNLPRVNGRELLQQIRKTPGLQTVPVVVLSTSNRLEDVRDSYALGANTYVEKPQDFNRFVSILQIIQRYWLDTALLPPAK